jgi:ubiquinone/menaquinone biosynthesis C-methylase UbiE
VEIDHASEDIASVFDRAAATYERVGPRFFSHFGRRVVDLVAPTNGARVLDVAAGAGAILIPAAERVGPYGRVIGVDLAESMVERLRQEIADRGVGNAEAQRMDAQALTTRPSTTYCAALRWTYFQMLRGRSRSSTVCSDPAGGSD